MLPSPDSPPFRNGRWCRCWGQGSVRVLRSIRTCRNIISHRWWCPFRGPSWCWWKSCSCQPFCQGSYTLRMSSPWSHFLWLQGHWILSGKYSWEGYRHSRNKSDCNLSPDSLFRKGLLLFQVLCPMALRILTPHPWPYGRWFWTTIHLPPTQTLCPEWNW